MEKSFSMKRVIIFAGSYVATIIGSGYATGQEIMQFFAYYGMTGVVAAFISMAIFILLAVEALNRGRLTKPKDSMNIFSLYLGKNLGKAFNVFVSIFLFAVFVVMVSGAGATLNEYYGLNPYVGRVGMVAVSYITVSLGLNKLSNVLGNIGPVIIIFTILVAAVSLSKNIGHLQAGIDFVNTAALQKPAPNGIFSGVLYASFNVILVVAFLAGLGSTTESKKECVWGGTLGGASLMVADLLMYLAILSQADTLFDKNIPTLVLADQISPLIGKLFSIVLMLGIFSTAAPLLWQVSNKLAPDGTKKFKVVALVIAVGGLVGGFLPFNKLVGTIYPYTGYIGIAMLVIIAFRVFQFKSKGSTGYDEMRVIENDVVEK